LSYLEKRITNLYAQDNVRKGLQIDCPNIEDINPTMKEVVRNEVLKLLEVDMIYPISDGGWVNPVHIEPKK